MPVSQCSNCSGPIDSDDLVIMHRRKLVGAVCAACTAGVRKPRVTMTRATRDGLFETEQYTAVEIFK